MKAGVAGFHFEDWLSNWAEHLPLHSPKEATLNGECNMANVTWEKRENTFFKLVNATGLCFTSCKLVQNSSFFFFLGEEFYVKYLSLPTLFISLRFGCVSCSQFSQWIEKEKKGFDTMVSLNLQFFQFDLVSHDTSVPLDSILFDLVFLCFLCFWRREI